MRNLTLLTDIALGLALVSATLSLAPVRELLSQRPVPACLEPPAKKKTTPALRTNAQTDVRLDGKPCKMANIPDTAEIIRLDALADGTVTVLHFRSKGAPPAGNTK